MIKITKRIPWLALVALLLVFAGCKGESPTAPPPGGSPPSGGTPPASGVTLNLSVSNAEPLVDSTVVVTATVSQNGQPVPNGTAVEFSSTAGGIFSDTNSSTTIRTTTNGVATATLTSSTPGTARITATVNNVTRSTDINWKARQTPPTPINTTPTVTGVTPAVGRPSGGETVRITGTNLRGPVRVLFDTGGVTPVEAFVVSRTDTQIEVLTPAVSIGVNQQLAADVIVITEAGSATEQRVERTGAFTFRNEILTPRITTASPNSGPVTGGTRVSIIGDGFQSPVQVLFGSAEARVIEVRFTEVIVEAPESRTTSPDGSAPITGPIDITVININSQTRTSLAGGFRYLSALQITSITPLVGPATGATDLTINGFGFDAPVDITVANVAAQPIFVSGTRIIARLGPLPSPCSTGGGVVVVRNIESNLSDIWGDAADESTFIYQAVPPRILTLDVPAGGIVAGQSLSAVVRNPGIGPLGSAEVTFLIGERPVPTSPNRITNGLGDQPFTITVPTNLDFPSVACTVGGEAGVQLGATVLSATFRNLTTSCSDSIPGAIRVIPDPVSNPCVIPPPPEIEQVVPIPPNCANAGTVAVADPATGTATITFRNTGGRSLVISPGIPYGANATEFTIPTTPRTVAPGGTTSFTVTFDPEGVGLREANIDFTTNDPDDDEDVVTVCVNGQGS